MGGIFFILLMKKLGVNGGSILSFFFLTKMSHHSAECFVVMRVKKISSSTRCGDIRLERIISFLLEIGLINILNYTLLGHSSIIYQTLGASFPERVRNSL